MTIRLHAQDLPDNHGLGPIVAIDTETMGLEVGRDRLCVVQLSRGDGTADVIKIEAGQTAAANLTAMLEDPKVLKLFHFARFDMASLCDAFGVMPGPVYCTKIASKLARTYTDRHGLKDVTRELLGLDISKAQQSSDWGADRLSPEQLAYAASDVANLHALRDRLDVMLRREGRMALAEACFAFLPHRAALDVAGWDEVDIFAHE